MNKDKYIQDLETVLGGAIHCLSVIKADPDVNLSKIRGLEPGRVEAVITAAALTLVTKDKQH